MKFRKLLLSSIGALTLLVGPASAETVLRYSNWLPATHVIHAKGIGPFIAEVERVTEGRVKIDTLPKVIGTVAGQYDVAVDGLADIAFIIMGYTPGRFTLSEVVELPFVGSDPEATSVAYWRTYTSELKKHGEFKGVHVLSLFVASASNIATTKKEIKTLSDLKGFKMRNPLASFIPAAEAMGTVPINKPISALYELASSGVVDGAFVPLDSMASFKLKEVLPYTTTVKGGLFSPGLALVINKASWDAISAADQSAIMAIAGEDLARKVGAGYAASDKASLEDMLKTDGISVKPASDALMAELKEKLGFVSAAWIEKAKKAGMDNAAEVLAKLQETVKSLQK